MKPCLFSILVVSEEVDLDGEGAWGFIRELLVCFTVCVETVFSSCASFDGISAAFEYVEVGFDGQAVGDFIQQFRGVLRLTDETFLRRVRVLM